MRIKPLAHKLFPFPWWVLIIGYILSFAIMITAATLIVLFGDTLGEKLATDWMISMILGCTKSMILIEPFKVCEVF